MSIISTIKGLFKKRSPHHNHDFTDADREAATEKIQMTKLMRKNNEILAERLQHLQDMQRQQQMKEQIENMEHMMGLDDEEDDYDDEDDDGEELTKGLLMGLLQKIRPQEQQNPVLTPVKPSLSEEQIRGILSTIPEKTLKMARNLDDDTLKRAIISYAPNIDGKSIEKAIVILRGS